MENTVPACKMVSGQNAPKPETDRPRRICSKKPHLCTPCMQCGLIILILQFPMPRRYALQSWSTASSDLSKQTTNTTNHQDNLSIPPRVLNLAFGIRSLSSAQWRQRSLHCTAVSAVLVLLKASTTVRCVDFEMHAFKLKLYFKRFLKICLNE